MSNAREVTVWGPEAGVPQSSFQNVQANSAALRRGGWWRLSLALIQGPSSIWTSTRLIGAPRRALEDEPPATTATWVRVHAGLPPPGNRAEPRHAPQAQEQGPPTRQRYHLWTRLPLGEPSARPTQVSAAALPCPPATHGRRLLGVLGLPLRRGLGPGKARRPLRTAKPDGVGRLSAVPAVVQPTPDRLRPDGSYLPRIQQAEPDGEAAGPFHARDQGAQLRLGVRGGAPAGGRDGRLRFIP